MQENKFEINWSEIEIGCVLRLLLYKLWMVVLAALSGFMAAAIILNLMTANSYRCSTDFVVSSRNANGISYYGNATAASEVVAIYSELLQGRFMKEMVAEAGDLSGEISASQMDDTSLIKVTVTSESPRDALLIMQVVLSRYGELSNYISSTTVLVPLNTPSIMIAPTREYDEAKITLTSGALCGLLMAAGICWISISSGTIQNTTGAKRQLEGHLLAIIPHEKLPGRPRFLKRVFERRKNRRSDEARLNIQNPSVSFRFIESVHRLAYRLEHEHDKGKKIFLFSSVSEAEGKSTLAANTAISLASRSSKVLFIDLDLRRLVQANILNIQVPDDQDLGNQLYNGRSAKDILASSTYDTQSGLSLLLSHQSYADKIGLITSPILAELLELARPLFDYIIIDTPPLGYFTDSELISDFSDASILVIRQDTVSVREINDAIDALNAGKAELLGYVLNDMRYQSESSVVSSGSRYGHYSKYGKYEKYEKKGAYSNYDKHKGKDVYGHYARKKSSSGGEEASDPQKKHHSGEHRSENADSSR